MNKWRAELKYCIRDEIENTIKQENIDRKRFYEVSKFEYEKIRRRFYYSFFEHEKYDTEVDLNNLDYLWLYFHKRLKKSPSRYDVDEYIDNIPDLINNDEKNKKFYLILQYGWVYEGYIPEIISVLNESATFYDFYIVSKKFNYLIVYSVDGDCIYTVKDENHSE